MLCKQEEKYNAILFSSKLFVLKVKCIELLFICIISFVKLEYYPTNSLDEAVEMLGDAANKPDENQFVEGIMFSSNECVVMVGNMVTSAEPGKV